MDNEVTYRGFWTWCSLCGEGDQEAEREGVEGGEAVYRSTCFECGDGFEVRVPAGTPSEERTAFLKWGGSRWQQFTGDAS